MSVDSSFSGDLAYLPQSHAGRSAAVARHGTRTFALGIAAILIGAGTIGALATGANLALSLLVGYAALASTLAWLRPGADAQPQARAVEPASTPQETAAAWKLVGTFTISDASRLLCNVEPGAAATQESIAWGRALIDAIKNGELDIAPKAGATPAVIERERDNPHYMTEVTREALRAWTDRRGAAPSFLRA